MRWFDKVANVGNFCSRILAIQVYQYNNFVVVFSFIHFRFRPVQKDYMCNFEKNVHARELGSSAFLPHNPPILLAQRINTQSTANKQEIHEIQSVHNKQICLPSYNEAIWLSGRFDFFSRTWLFWSFQPAFWSFQLSGRSSFLVVPAFWSFQLSGSSSFLLVPVFWVVLRLFSGFSGHCK
jgi:hypothetical protein